MPVPMSQNSHANCAAFSVAFQACATCTTSPAGKRAYVVAENLVSGVRVHAPVERTTPLMSRGMKTDPASKAAVPAAEEPQVIAARRAQTEVLTANTFARSGGSLRLSR